MLSLLITILLLAVFATRRTSSNKASEELHYDIEVERDQDPLETESGQLVQGTSVTKTGTESLPEASSSANYDKDSQDLVTNEDHEHDVCRSPTSLLPKRTRRPSIVNGDGVMSTIMEDILGSSAFQREEDEIEFSNYEDYEKDMPEDESADPRSPSNKCRTPRCDSNASTSSSSYSKPNARISRAHNAKEAESHQHQPHISSREHRGHGHEFNIAEIQQGLAARIMDFAQENNVMKFLDGISGGILGTTMGTVAIFAKTAEVATGAVSQRLPEPLSDIDFETSSSQDSSSELKSSHLTTKDKGKAKAEDSEPIDNENHDQNISSAPVMVANVHRSRSKRAGDAVHKIMTGAKVEKAASKIKTVVQGSSEMVKESVQSAGNSAQTATDEIMKAVEAALAFAEKTRVNTVVASGEFKDPILGELGETISKPENVTSEDSPRDILSSVKHFTGEFGDSASEVIAHTAEITSQTLIKAKDTTTGYFEAAKNDFIGSDHKQNNEGMHKGLQDIKNDIEDTMKFKGISASDSSSAVRARQAAIEYYESLPTPIGCLSPSQPSSSSTTVTAPSSIVSKCVRHEAVFTGRSHQIPFRRGSLDHNEYIFRNSNGDPISADELSEESDDCDDDFENDVQENESRGIMSIAPSIISSAKTAASAVAARVTDVSYENIDEAKSTLTGIVSNMVGTLTRRDKAKYENNSDEWRDDTMTRSSPALENEETNLTPATATLASSKPDLTNISAFKPNLKSRHIDEDGFTVVEDSHHPQDHEDTSSIITASQDLPPPPSTPHMNQDHRQAHTPITSQLNLTVTQKKKPSTHLASSDLSYSRATAMNLAESDHGVRIGITDNYDNDSISSEESSLEDQGSTENHIVSASPTITVDSDYHRQSAVYHNQLLHQVIHPHGANLPSSPPTTYVSFEHGHGMLHGADTDRGGSSSFRNNSQNSNQDKIGQEEYIANENGKKVSVVDDRRDSGVDTAS
ncbi:hypothetical protein BGX27_006614 [Mortierella sp. AM989]|nr:hypothetical protein BGX27_006614 [Mortierella sp. AM989]